MAKNPGPVSLTLAQQVDAACDRFEAAWLSGTKPKLEEFLPKVDPADVPQFLRSLLRVEVELLEKEGQNVTAESFAERFEEYGEVVAEVLRSHAAKSGNRATKTREVRTFSLRDASIDTSFIEIPVSSKKLKQAPKQLGRFKILKVLGEGAFGTVYHAHDPQLDREVALKVPRAGVLETQEDIDRFLQEARAVADLRHAHVCPIYDFGKIDDEYFIVMAYIAGKPLSSVLVGGRKIADHKIAAVIRKISFALEAAHKLGVVHRDLKPANIMIDKQGDPVVMDFGLARRMTGDEAQLTHSGAILGTPAYMPPEQAKGNSNAVGPQSDVYSLGVILYELLCGQRPFSGSVAEVFASILHREPPPPSTHRSNVDPQLEAICLKAIAKQPNDRYASMAALAETLTEYLRVKREGDPNSKSGVSPSLSNDQSSSIIPVRQRKKKTASDSSLIGFNPYHKWLGIPTEEQPANHYRLLSLRLLEDDPDVIEAAAERQMSYLHQIATGPHLELAQQLLNELAAAKLCLLNAKQKTVYDTKLKTELAAKADEYDADDEVPYDDTEFDDLQPRLRLRAEAVEKSPWWENPRQLLPAIGGASLVILLAAVMIIKISRAPVTPKMPAANNVASSDQADAVPPEDAIGNTNPRHLIPVYDASSGQMPQQGGWTFQGNEMATMQSGTLLHDAQSGGQGFWTATTPIDAANDGPGIFMETTAKILEENHTSTIAGLTLLDIRSHNLAAALVAQDNGIIIRDTAGSAIDRLKMDTTDGFHTYRLEMADETFWLFVDGELKLHETAAQLRPPQVNGNSESDLVATFGDASGVESVSSTEYRHVSFGDLSAEGGPTVLRDRNNFENPRYPANLDPLVLSYDASQGKLPSTAGWTYQGEMAQGSSAEISSRRLLHNAEMSSYSFWTATLPASRAPQDAGMFMEANMKVKSENHTTNQRGYNLMEFAEITPTKVRGISVLLWENRIFLIDSDDNLLEGAELDWNTSDDFHAYRAEVKEDRFWLYIDGQEKLSGRIPTYPTTSDVTNLLPDGQKTLPRLWAKFGDGTNASESVTETKSVTFGSLSARGGPTALRKPTDYDHLLTGYWQSLLVSQNDVPDWKGALFKNGTVELNDYFCGTIGSRPYRDAILRGQVKKLDSRRHLSLLLRMNYGGDYEAWYSSLHFGLAKHGKDGWEKLGRKVPEKEYDDFFDFALATIGNQVMVYVDGHKLFDKTDLRNPLGLPGLRVLDCNAAFRNLQIMDLTRGPFRPDEGQTDRVSTITPPILPKPKIQTPDEPVQTSQPPKDDEDHDSSPLPPKVAHDPEFLNLFNGKNLTGWIGNVADFTAKNGKLVYSGRLKGRLTTKRKFQDFILRFDFRLESGADNGIGIRQSFDAPFAPKGIEIQILDEEFPKHKNINKPSQHNGSIFDYAAAKQGHLKPLGEWNSQEITCRGNHIVVNLNGVKILDTTIDPGKDTPAHLKHPWGTIALLGERGRAEFCNIRIKDLGNPAAAAPAKKISFANPMPPATLAHWVFSQGGSVSAMQNERIFKPLTSPSQLPRGAYTVILVSLIGKSQITDSDLARFANLPLFKTLDLGTTGVTDDGMAVVGAYRKLCTLGLVGTEVTDRGLSKLAGLTLLQSLLLRGTNISDEGMQALQHMRNMQTLELSTETGNFSDQGVLYLGRMINLQHLAISGGTISDAGLELIAKFPQLERLYISNHMITDKGLKHLRQIPKLNRLHIGGNFGVTDIGLIQLAKLKNLASLEVGSNPNITDAGLKQLGRMRNLSTLVLDDNLNVTDAGLVHLQRLNKLTYLGLRHTSVTEQGAKALKAKLPQCKIYYGYRKSLK